MDLNGFTPSRRVERHIDGNGYTVYVKPPKIVGEYPEVCVTLTLEQYQRYLLWREGPLLIQDALPELSPSTREMLMTGLCDEDFQKIAHDPEE
jgi:hypothetical protein